MSLPTSNSFPGSGDFRPHVGGDERLTGAYEGEYLDPEAAEAWKELYDQKKLYQLVELSSQIPHDLLGFGELKRQVLAFSQDEQLDGSIREAASGIIDQLDALMLETFPIEIIQNNNRAVDALFELAEEKPGSFDDFVRMYEAYFAIGCDLTLQDRVRISGDEARFKLSTEYPEFYQSYLKVLEVRREQVFTDSGIVG